MLVERPARNEEVRCPFCRDALGPEEAHWACPACGTRQHAECAVESGRCATFGCAGKTPARVRLRTSVNLPVLYAIAGAIVGSFVTIVSVAKIASRPGAPSPPVTLPAAPDEHALQIAIAILFVPALATFLWLLARGMEDRRP